MSSAESTGPGEDNTYTLSCHCKANVFTIGPISNIYSMEWGSCNCSLCNDRGSITTRIPGDKIKLVKGGVEAGALKEYQFNQKKVNWLFCKECGSTIGASPVDSEAMNLWGLNFRCIEGVDIAKLNAKHYDGKSIEKW